MPTCYLYWITYLLLNCVILTYHGVTGAPIDVFDQLPSDTEYRGATINRDSLAADLNAMSEGMEEEGMEEEGMEARSIDPFIFGLIMNLVRDVEDEMHTENGSIKESLAMRKSGLEKQLLARASTPSVAKPDPDSFDSDHFAPDSDTEKKTGVDLDRNASGYAEESDIVANPLVQRIDEPLKNH